MFSFNFYAKHKIPLEFLNKYCLNVILFMYNLLIMRNYIAAELVKEGIFSSEFLQIKLYIITGGHAAA
jgi:hypothetical protein